MPVTPNILLQAAATAKTQAASANTPALTAEPGDKASSFAEVYANQAQNKPVVIADKSASPATDNAPQGTGKPDVSSDKAAAPEPAVADSGNSLPADKPAPTDDATASDDKPETTDTPVADAPPVEPSLDPALDPALMQAVQPLVAVPVAQAPAPVVTSVAPQVEAPVAAAIVAAPAQAGTATVDSDFDPEADPLDALPAVRLAMEQGGHVSASSQAQPKASPAQAQADGEPTSAQSFAVGMASMLDVQADQDSTSQGGEKAFSGLIDDGLKDLKSASSDTRVDDFANRLAALTQAATPKTANALPVNQPIAMHQSGWTEEVVNRVMYLSSANLKAADIQLQPAELGRLDIRVNMVPDQQTQVTFMSAHPSVREALDGQMHRLRDMFAQQGMGQVDVNVSDQSRGWQGQEQAQQGQGGRSNASGGRLDSVDEELPATVAEVAASTSVIGSSAVDYYA
ncbi:flagellar hook-length control protein FliK [Pseudomonas lini]|uniref:Flagellar hook-length control protein FliK n=1 Tax=Pseudomonas lini TaxID=163011 RepID=A0A0J6HBL5_9PSED|nr:flagellar hook-length control protein FliK [Pseudomonas lini]KAB0506235.1 flagellar hook-length control protein FliK [Pseudomonas lini]KMM94361.1 flagellar hook-length control protein [Pseudomonas lini]KNH47989.1 flagellar hook-length control protein [Pseudomonas lini]NSX08958.1 flagellar hook-length control protein FliK [Pseudomonas lini]SDT60746.1 flagellar hook-length control protein FliK [Pseudomonas lini]